MKAYITSPVNNFAEVMTNHDIMQKLDMEYRNDATTQERRVEIKAEYDLRVAENAAFNSGIKAERDLRAAENAFYGAFNK